ncbi:hypothetical protein [Pseudoteredinibacter isoporae]|uniref:Lipoprotein n=1 Tax=Pseudoteredinibacter isoporae TaxID=570281 RepID=A0A7X0JW54_9GAMM|nr:hypothetical protein [Pseudoteredinibacter isoporae]MBB6522381.1 hypothetical protein [Pseudoteredinibacter isoporae]NHO87914.1 hypothetical protein [Pseudoteredinibacter isoporae]NIB23755.1 hypothetical protein [Pseudoteredinibacter isoporae]
MQSSNKPRTLVTLLLLSLFLSACASHTVKTTRYVQLQQETAEIPENQLLDVGVELLDPNLEQIEEDDSLVFAEVRKAESHYMAGHIRDALQASSAWGAVRLIPNQGTLVDVQMSGRILHSDGETLEMAISVKDITGRKWYDKDYKAVASRYAYRRETASKADPFQTLYHQIANDLLQYRKQLEPEYLRRTRLIGELRFAESFAPQSFGGQLQQDKKGIYHIERLPAENDPMLERVRTIRERDHLYIDTLQDFYGSFIQQIDGPYRDWRKQTYSEVINLREVKESARNQTIAGIVSVLAGIAAATSNNRAVRTAGGVAIGGGGYLIKEGFGKRAEADMHSETIRELGDSLEAAIQPQVIELEDRTITLSGSVQQQYEQWRQILRELYDVENGKLAM